MDATGEHQFANSKGEIKIALLNLIYLYNILRKIYSKNTIKIF